MQGIEQKISAGAWIRSVDARVKLMTILIYIITATTLQDQRLLWLAAVLLLLVSLLVGVGPIHILKRLLLILPFGGVMVSILPFVIPGETLFTWNWGFIHLEATVEGWRAAVLPCQRMLTAFLGMVLLTSTTTLQEIIHALNHLKFPKIFILLIDFTLRYVAVVMDELNRMQTARFARGFTPGRHFWQRHTGKTLGSTLAMLFLRSYERAERVYLAMLARGYTGEYQCCGHCHRIKKWDLCWGSSLVTAGWFIKFIELGGAQWILQLR